jgi:hypothetical protein
MDFEVVGTLIFFFCVIKLVILGGSNVSSMSAFGFSQGICAAQASSQPYQRPSDFDTFMKFYHFLKEIACKLIWWRPRIKIHIPTPRMGFKINSLKLCFICQHRI